VVPLALAKTSLEEQLPDEHRHGSPLADRGCIWIAALSQAGHWQIAGTNPLFQEHLVD
jgi:hypothetical protein